VKTPRSSEPSPIGASGSPLERRASPRVATSLAARLGFSHLSGLLDCRIRDLGTGGACVQTPVPFALTDVERIELRLSDRAVVLRVAGCWQRETLIENAVLTGVRFLDAGERELSALREYLKERAAEIVRFLQTRSEFARLDFEDVMAVALVTRMREARVGAHVCEEGKLRLGDDSVFILMKGSVVLEAAAARALDVELEFVEPGGIFGGLPLIAQMPSPLSAVVARDATLLELDRTAFRYLAQTRPWLAEELRRLVVERNVEQLRGALARLASAR
jgi:CRP-like cAMP-binding protein